MVEAPGLRQSQMFSVVARRSLKVDYIVVGTLQQKKKYITFLPFIDQGLS